MSAVRKEEILQIWNVEPAHDEPEFFDESGLDLAPFPGPHQHSNHDLHCLWSLVWKRWGNQRVCYEVIRYNRLFSVDWWREAIEETWITKPNMSHLRYVIAMAHTFQKEGTPTERMAKKLAEANKAAKIQGDIQTTETVRQFWIDKGKTTTIDDVGDQDPVFLRMYNKIKGGAK
ncbi:MAG: hypothetical protein P4L67_04685 [Candidatus Pacebacteria bacterium]|nr:hypothetical protein [Candidatus Paceibacterota bacterium]